VSNYGKFSNFSDIFANLNDFLQIIGLVLCCTTSMIHTFHFFKKIIYKRTDHWNTHIPRGTKKFKYLYTHGLCNALNFYKNIIILK
jgi:hypothetical protein